MRPHLLTALIAAGTLLSLQSAALAEDVYRWTDENGTVHFGSLPPQGVDAELVSSLPAAAHSTAGNGADGQAPESAAATADRKSPGQIAREERQKRRAEQRKDQELLEPQCAAMREQLAQVEPHTRVIVQDEDGQVRRLEDSERLKMVEDAKTFIAENCQDIP